MPRALELPGNEAIIRREGARLVVAPVPVTPLRALLAEWATLDEGLPELENLPAEPVEL